MKRVRYGFYSLLFVLSLITSLTVPSGIASATSDYDNVIFSQESAELPNWVNNQYEYMDVSTSWYDIISPGAAKDSFDDARQNGGHWMLVNAQDWLVIIWSNDPLVATSFFYAYGHPSWGIAPGNLWGTIRLNAVDRVIYQESFLNQTSWNIVYLGEKPDPLPRTGLVFSNYNNVYPSGYEGLLIPTELPPAKYAGLGDSYSSAEGNPTFEYGTDVSNVNGCHRSPQAYPRLLQSRLELGPTAFAACSGATTTNITESGQWNEPPQIDAITDETEIVTLTIGGNDVGFADYAMACNVACGPGTTAYNTIMGKINDSDFKDSLVATYEAILAARPNADLDLYVADYPYLAAEDATMCWGLDFSGAYEVQEALNEVIFDAVIEVGMDSNHIFMVQTNYLGSPFEGGHLCNGGDPLFHGIVAPPNLEYSLHPDADGQVAYAEVFEEYIG